jgi:hypothetical protein
LLDPKAAFWSAHAPATVTADIETSRGVITIELVREWAPVGVDHFYNLVRAGYYDDTRFSPCSWDSSRSSALRVTRHSRMPGAPRPFARTRCARRT